MVAGKYILKALVMYTWRLRQLRMETPDDDEEEDDDEEFDREAEWKELQKWLNTLREIDPMRKGMYNDLGMLCSPISDDISGLTSGYCRENNEIGYG